MHELSDHMAETWPAFRSGLPNLPPDQHVLQHLLSLHTEDGDGLTTARTVAIVRALPACDLCGRALARYDSLDLKSDGWANLCTQHMSLRGSSQLGNGRAQYLMLLAEVPHSVRQEVERLVGPDDLWGLQGGPSWAGAYRSVGFGEPDEREEMGREIDGWSVYVRSAGPGVLIWTCRQVLPELRWANESRYVVPSEWDAGTIRIALRDALGLNEAAVARYGLQLTLQDAEQIAFATLDQPTYQPSLGHRQWIHDNESVVFAVLQQVGSTDILSGPSLPAAAARLSAKTSTNTYLVERLAFEHPELSVRFHAIANPTLDPEALTRLAANADLVLGEAILRRQDLPPEAVATLAGRSLTETLATSGVRLTEQLMLHTDTPIELLPVLAERVRMTGGDIRVSTAEASRGLAPERRHIIHTQLLLRSRSGKITDRVIDAILGPPDEADGPGVTRAELVDWFLTHENRGIRRLGRERCTALGLVPEEA